MASLGEAVVEVGADTSKFKGQTQKGVDDAVKKTSGALDQMGRKMQSVGQKATLGLTLPLSAVAVQAVRTQASFETSMNTLSAATGIAGDSLADLQQQAKDLGADTVFSANEAAEAMVELGKSGFKAAQISAAIPEVMNLAATEGMNLADASGVLTTALAQFGLKASKSGKVVNALAGAANASRSSVASLGESLKLVGSAGAAIGLTVNETAAALAALSDAGLDGSVAGTSLAAVFNHLVPQTTKARKAMAALNLDFTKADGSFVSIDEIAGKLRKSFKGMDQESRKIAISQIFGNDASTIAAVNALVASGKKGLQEYTTATKDQSAAQKLADARMKGTAGAIERMQGSLETAALAAGEALAPAVTDAADAVADLADKFTNLDPNVQKVILGVGGLAAASGPTLMALGSMARGVSAVNGLLSTMASKTDLAGGKMTRMGVVMRGVAGTAGMGLLAKGATETSKTMSTLEGAAGGALAGFAVGGPWGAAIGAGAGAMLTLATNTATAGDAAFKSTTTWQTYAQTLDNVTGATTKATEAMVLQEARESGLLKNASAMGIDKATLINGILGEADARAKLEIAMRDEQTAIDKLAATDWDSLSNEQNTALSEELIARQKNLKALRSEVGEINKSTAAKREDLLIMANIPDSVITQVQTPGAVDSKRELAELSAVMKLTPKQIKTIMQVQGIKGSKADVMALRDELIATGKIKPTGAWANMFAPPLKKAKQDVKKETDDMNGLLMNAITAKPKLANGPFGNAMRKQMGTIKNETSTGGSQAGSNYGAGFYHGLDIWMAPVVTRAYNMARAAVAAGNRGIDANSPSKETEQTATWMGEGYVRGLQNVTPKVVAAATATAQAGTKAFKGVSDKAVKAFGKGINLGTGDIAENAMNNLMDAIAKAGDRKKNKISKKAEKTMRGLVNAIDKQAEKLRDKIKERDDLVASTRDTALGEVDLEKLFRYGIGSATGGLGAIAARLTAFAGKIKALGAAGVPQAIINEIAAMGSVKGSKIADKFLQASAADQQAFLGAYGAVANVSQTIGNTLGEINFGPMVANLTAALQQAVAAAGLSSLAVGPKPKKVKPPKRATGGFVPTMVGERGAELVSLQPYVHKNSESKRIASMTPAPQPAGDTSVVVNMNNYGPQTGRDKVRELEWAMRYGTKARG